MRTSTKTWQYKEVIFILVTLVCALHVYVIKCWWMTIIYRVFQSIQDWWRCCHGNRSFVLWKTFQNGFHDNACTARPSPPPKSGLHSPIPVPPLCGRRRRRIQPQPKTTPTKTEERPQHQTEQQLWDGERRHWRREERPARDQRDNGAGGGWGQLRVYLSPNFK